MLYRTTREMITFGQYNRQDRRKIRNKEKERRNRIKQ